MHLHVPDGQLRAAESSDPSLARLEWTGALGRSEICTCLSEVERRSRA